MTYDLKIETDNKILYAKYLESINSFGGLKINKDVISFIESGDLKEYLSAFKLSKNNKFLGNNDGMDIYLDLDTNFVFSFKNGQIDINSFLKNGRPSTVYIEGNFKENVKNYVFKILKSGTTITLSATLLFSSTNLNFNSASVLSFDDKFEQKSSSFATLDTDSTKTMIQKIKESKKIDNVDKEILCNKDYLNFISKYLNDSPLGIIDTCFKLNGISIKQIDGEAGGYYSSLTPNTLHINSSLCDKTDHLNIYSAALFHEFVHLTEENYDHEVLLEALTQMLNVEFNNAINWQYNDEQKMLKVLMEIIGKEPILKMYFSNDPTSFKSSIKKYLTNEDDVDKFYDCIDFIYGLDGDKLPDTYKKEYYELVSKMYTNKFGSDMFQNEKILSILSSTDIFNYYFKDVEEMTIDQAIEEGFALIYAKGGSSDKSRFEEYVISRKEDGSAYYHPILIDNDKISDEYLNGKYTHLMLKINNENLNVVVDGSGSVHLCFVTSRNVEDVEKRNNYEASSDDIELNDLDAELINNIYLKSSVNKKS